MTRFALRLLLFFVVGMAGGIFATQVVWPYFVEKPINEQIRMAPIVKHDQTIAKANADLTQAVADAEKSIVGVGYVSSKKEYISGSGLILTNDGLVLSLSSIVSQSPSIFYNNETISSKILKRDIVNNLAIQKIEKNDLPACRFASSDGIKLGEKVFLMGKRFDGKTFTTFVDDGIIKSFDGDMIQTNISEDKSVLGTVLFNINGEVLGINYLSPAGKVISVPVSKIRQFINF